jgi:hypothetical protein
MLLTIYPQRLTQQVTGQEQLFPGDFDEPKIDKRVTVDVTATKFELAPDFHRGLPTGAASAHANPLHGLIQHIGETRRNVQFTPDERSSSTFFSWPLRRSTNFRWSCP